MKKTICLIMTLLAVTAPLFFTVPALAARKKIPVKFTWTEADGEKTTYKLKHDKNGNIVDFGAKNRIKQYKYKKNRLSKITFEGGSQASSITFKYDKKGRIKTSTYKMPGDEYKSKYTYKKGLLTSRKIYDGKKIWYSAAYTYSKGKIRKIVYKDNNGEILGVVKFNKKGYPKSATYGYGEIDNTYTYSYNSDGTVKKIVEKYPAGDEDGYKKRSLKISYKKVKVKKAPAKLPVEYDPIIGQFMRVYWSILPFYS